MPKNHVSTNTNTILYACDILVSVHDNALECMHAGSCTGEHPEWPVGVCVLQQPKKDICGYFSYEQGYFVQFQRACRVVGDPVVASGDAEGRMMAPEAFGRIETVHEALQHLAFLMLSVLDSQLENSQFYLLKDKELGESEDVTKIQLQRWTFSAVSWEVLLRVMGALVATRLQEPSAEVAEIDEKWEVMRHQVDSETATTAIGFV